jgi:competence protein ComEC
MTNSQIFLYLCLSFIGGIFINSFYSIPQPILLSFLILAILFISVFFKHKKFLIFGICVLSFSFGIWKCQTTFLKIKNSPVKYFIGREVILTGKITEETKMGEKSQKLLILPEEIEGKRENSFGKVLIWTRRYPEYGYGDLLRIEGILEEPKNFNHFDYKNFLAKDEIYSSMSFPKIEFLGENFGNPIRRALFSFKNKLKESLNIFLSPPQSGLLEALLFGDEEKISEAWKEKFNLTSTRHITAVSGMNITIIAFLILNFLLMLGFWRQQAFYFSIILIIFYILMIGAPASAIRAGIMGLLLLTAQYFGRLSTASRSLVFAGAVMLFFNPLLLKYDLGFQLSFLATAGLVYLQPILQDFSKKIPNFLQLRNNLSATLSAQIFVLPILIYNFGQISIISPITNILILPLIPLVTILGFIFSFIGIFWQSLAQILSWSAWLLLTYILKIIDFSSKIPFISFIFKNVHWIFLVIFYLILGSLVSWLNQKKKLEFLSY